MALLDFEGFDRETNLALSNWFTQGIGSGTVSADGTGSQSYGRYCNVPYGNGRSFANTQTLWFQSHVWITSAPGGDWNVKLYDGANVQVLMGFDATLRAKCWIDGGSVSSTSPVLGFGAWYFVQYKVHIASIGGYVEVWVNGVLQHTFSGDTQLTANAYVNSWGIFNAGTDRHDNIVIYDLTGDAPNDRTSETRIYAELATGDDTVTWTPSAGANFECIDEQPNDGDTTYVSSSAAQADIYTFPANTVPAGNVVYAVAVEYVARKDDGGTNVLEPLLNVGGTSYLGTSNGLTATYQRFRSYWANNPATSAPWSVTAANAAKAGINRSS